MAVSIGDLIARITLDDQLSSKLDKMGSKISAFGSAMLPISAAITAVGGASIVMAAKFEDSLSKMVSLAGVSKDELEGVKQHILDLAPAVGIGPQALAEAMMVVSSTTSDTTVALEILDMAAKASAAGMGEAKDVAKALTAIVNSYGSENISAARAADILTKAVQDGGAEATELAPVLANVVPVAAQLGISFEQVAANIATVTKLGTPAAEAVTQLSSVMTAMLKPTADGEKALASIGMTFESLRESVREKGLQAALQDLVNAFGDNKTAIADVFGRVEALRNVMATAGQQAEVYANEITRMAESAGALDKAFMALDGSTTRTWGQFRAQIEVVAIALGDQLAGSLAKVLKSSKPLLDGIVELIKAFSELPEWVQTTIIGFTAFIAVLGPAAMALGMLVSAVGAIAGAMSLLASPIVLVTGAAAALTIGAGALVVALVGVDEITRIAKEGMDALKIAFNEVKDVMGPLVRGELNTLKAAFKELSTVLGPVVISMLENMVRGLRGVVIAWLAFKDTILSVMTAALAAQRLVTFSAEGRAEIDRNIEELKKLRAAAGETAAQLLKGAPAQTAVVEATKKAADVLGKQKTATDDVAKATAALVPVTNADIVAKLSAADKADKLAKATEIMGQKITDLPTAERVLKLADGFKNASKYAEIMKDLVAGVKEGTHELFTEFEATGSVFADQLSKLPKAPPIFEATVTDAATQRLYALGKSLAETAARGGMGVDQITSKLEGMGLEAWQVKTIIESLGPVFANIKKEAEKITFGSGLAAGLKNAMKDLPSVVMNALQGGGNVTKAVGGLFGGSIAEGISKPLTAGLSKVLGKTVGGVIGSVIPGLGTILGSGLGGVLGKAFGSIFGNKAKKELKETKSALDEYIKSQGGLDALNQKARLAGVSIDSLFSAKNKGQLSKALDEINGKLGLFDQANAAVQEAIDRWGLSVEEMGPKFAQAKLEEVFGSYIKDYEVLKASQADMNAVIAKMGPEVNKTIQEAVRAGQAIPEAMKPIVDAMIAQGLLLDENGKAYGSAEEAGIKYSKSVSEVMMETLDVVKQLTEYLLQMNGIKIPPVKVPVEYQYPGEPADPSDPSDPYKNNRNIPEYGAGAVVSRPTLAVVGEKGPEAIIPWGDVMELVRGGGGSRTEQHFNLTVQEDPYQTAEGRERLRERTMEIMRDQLYSDLAATSARGEA